MLGGSEQERATPQGRLRGERISRSSAHLPREFRPFGKSGRVKDFFERLATGFVFYTAGVRVESTLRAPKVGGCLCVIKLTLPAGDHHTGQTISHHIHRSSSHIHQCIHPQDQKRASDRKLK